MQKLYKIFFILLSFNIHSQEDEQVDINVERVNTIQELLNQVQVNKSIYKNDDSKRIAEFLELVDERQLILNKTKTDLKNEQARNTRLELSFEKNEKELAELQERLQIKIGVLGELFGVARQFSGELFASTENGFTFYENPKRPDRLKEIGKIQVHNLSQLEELWLAYFGEIASSGEVKKVSTNVIDESGISSTGEIVRYGLFSAAHDGGYVTPSSELNGFKLLQRQPESSITRTLSKHYKADEYSSVAIDPTRGFLLSLYLDKASWFQRISQGKSIGYVIILIGLIGLAFSIWKIRTLAQKRTELDSDESIIQEMIAKTKNNTSYESKENILDELILNYSANVEKGVSWIKFFAAVAPLLGLLGTVIGMIETFQAITLFGTGDPKQMAGGISQALVTTMLGLIVAAPLLGFYTFISDKVSSLIQVVEEKASYILSK
ncbi:MotA/TolQ/ExbB proton channel family protein [Gammaproteobacteria bacterium]|nr:MotA/TolQ/ExbB proton channel family protein [Gammaproteobacteria bacterium]